MPPLIRPGVQNIDGTRAQVKPKSYRLSDFDPVNFSTDTKAFAAAEGYQQAYELDISDGIGEAFGRGASENPLQAQGFAGIRFVNDTAAAKAEGSFRIAVRTANGRRLYNLVEGDLETFDLFDGAAGSGTEKDRKNREPLAQRSSNFETEPRKLTLDLDVETDITVDDAESETRMKMDGYQAEALE
jgi:hypothetical protein